jgi:predicted transcriptional regulator of viral defense system
LWAKKRAVVGGESALDLHELCDVNPRFVTLLTPRSYRPRKRGGEFYRVRHADVPEADVEEVNDIPVLVPRRAIADAAADGVDPRLIEQAIVTALRRRDITERAADELREILPGNSNDRAR